MITGRMITGQPAATVPYCGPVPVPADFWRTWNLDPLLIAALGVLLIWGLPRGQTAKGRRALFIVGWSTLVVAFVSPLCALTTALFSARAAHHLLLVGIAAPAFAAVLPISRVPLAAGFVLTALALTGWHLPGLYALAWTDTAVYWLMQAMLLGPAWAFWSVVIAPRSATAETAAINALMIGALAGTMGLIGAVLTFSTRILYPEHLGGALAWGMEPLTDQQLAGLVMWVPGLIPLAVVSALMLRRAWQRGVAA